MSRIIKAGAAGIGLAAFLLATTAPAALAASKTEHVSVSSAGGQGNEYSGDASISGNGRFTAFASDASNLVLGDTNASRDVFVHDRTTGETRLVSVDNAGVEGNDYSRGPLISREARRVVFSSQATNLVANDTNGLEDLFLRDLEGGTTTRVSLLPGGSQFGSDSSINAAAISADALLVAFAVNVGPKADTGAVYVRDVKAGATALESLSAGGAPPDDTVYEVAMSGDGRRVAFSSDARNLAQGTADDHSQVYLRDRVAKTLTEVSLNKAGDPANGSSGCPALTGDGRTIAFCSNATDLVPGAQPKDEDYLAYVRDLATGVTSRLDVLPGGAIPDQDVFVQDISGDGRYVLLSTGAALSPLDTNGDYDLYVFDRQAGTSTLASARADGRSAKDPQIAAGRISQNGRAVVFDSDARNLVPGDTNGQRDTFVHQLPKPAAAR